MRPAHVERLDEVRAKHLRRLGRHVEHDDESRSYALTYDAGAPLVSTTWERHGGPFDQGEIGRCTGNAMAGLLITEPFYKPGRDLTEDDADALYRLATKLDRIPGVYPPDDTGSSGLAVMKAAKQMGYIDTYHHAFGFTAAMHALMRGPVIAGIAWFEGFDDPAADGTLEIAGTVRGGHEVELLELDVENERVRGINSWGDSFAVGGYFYWSFDTFRRLLAMRGDVTLAGVKAQ